MENKVLGANLNAVKKYDSTLCDEILRTNNIKSNFELTKTVLDEYNLVFNSTALHSQTGAADEAKKIVSGIKDIEEKNAIRIIYGLGLGYLVDEFINSTQADIIIYEPNIEILRTVFEILEFHNNLSKKNVTVCSNKQKLFERIDILADKETKITVSFLTSYLNLFKNEIYELVKNVEYVHGEKQANLNTINKLSDMASLNTLSNLNEIIKTPVITSFKDIYKGKTALIASAGPSLAQNIDTIKKNRSKFILFAVGPALKLLVENGIKPDYLCIVEILNTLGQIESIDVSDINLIFEPFSNPYLWNINFKNKILFASKDNFLNNWLTRTLNINNPGLKSIGTVSYCALSSAKIMGFNKIILCGQDLAFKDGNCYAKGSAYEDLECVLNNETNKYEIRVKDFEAYKQKLAGSANVNKQDIDTRVQSYIQKMNSTLYTVTGQDGKILPTQACYAIFIKHFEEFAKNNPDISLINSSTGGAQINGYENLNLKDALKSADDIAPAGTFNEAPSYNLEKLKFAKENTKKLLLSAGIDAKTILDIQSELLKELARRKSFNKNTQKLEEKTAKLLTDFARKYYNNDVLYYLCTGFTNIIAENLKIQKTKNMTTYIKYIEYSRQKAQNLIDAINKAIIYLSDK